MNCLMLFHSKYGQTQKIISRIADAFKPKQISVITHDVTHLKNHFSVKPFDMVVVGAPVYFTRHSKQLVRLLKENDVDLHRKTTAFFSVSLSAAGTARQREDAEHCLSEFLKRANWQPTFRTIFAGGLPYQKYGWFTRWIMKRIAGKAGGDIDTSCNHEYTNWDEVDAFAHDLIEAAAATYADSQKGGNVTSASIVTSQR